MLYLPLIREFLQNNARVLYLSNLGKYSGFPGFGMLTHRKSLLRGAESVRIASIACSLIEKGRSDHVQLMRDMRCYCDSRVALTLCE